jgi:hypothetical protein
MAGELMTIIEQLKDMAGRTTRHRYDIGDYWNAVEEASEALTKKDAEIADLRKLFESEECALDNNERSTRKPGDEIAYLKAEVSALNPCGHTGFESFVCDICGYPDPRRMIAELRAKLAAAVKGLHSIVKYSDYYKDYSTAVNTARQALKEANHES